MDGSVGAALYEQALHVAGIAIIFGLLIVLYNGSFSPLAKLPGPWYTKYTSVVDKYYGVTRQPHFWVQSLHEKYGPIVRTAPDRVYVADPATVQYIHKLKTEFKKGPWYHKLVPGTRSVITTTDSDAHRRFRKLLSGPMSENGLKAVLPQVEGKVRLAIQRMGEEMRERGAVDVWKWYMMMATDVIGELSFGESFRMLEYKKVNQYIEDLQTLDRTAAVRVTFPFVDVVGQWLPVPAMRRAKAITPRMLSYAEQSLARHKTLLENGDANVSQTLLQKVYAANESESMTWAEVTATARGYIIAGSDTTSNTLTWLTWAVCKHPAVRERLVAEVATLSPDFSSDDVKRLPYLNCVIEESLRLWPAVPGGLPRVAPPEGATLHKCFIPGGTMVMSQAYTLQRNPEAFPNPEVFDPSRWLNPTPAMRECFMPFAGGSRICLGIHLAYIEMRMATARFFRAFPNATVSNLEGMCDEDMIEDAFFLASPRGHRCLINAM